MTTNPNEVWMSQMSRNLLDSESGVLSDKRFLIIDRDTKYSSSFRRTLERDGIEVIRLPPRSPNLNAYAERFVRSVKQECLSRLIPIGSSMLSRALREYVDHYHRERNHQGIGNRTIMPLPTRCHTTQTVHRRPRLGGILSFYQRAAA
jgi:putative transposase